MPNMMATQNKPIPENSRISGGSGIPSMETRRVSATTTATTRSSTIQTCAKGRVAPRVTLTASSASSVRKVSTGVRRRRRSRARSSALKVARGFRILPVHHVEDREGEDPDEVDEVPVEAVDLDPVL